MKRYFDLFLGLTLFILLFFLMLVIAIAIRLTSRGPLIYWSDRVGINNTTFKMPKFRSMRVETPDLATHLLENPEKFLSPIGGFLRRTSLDEIPQLFSIIKGDMSFIGPRPALYNQDDLIYLRTKNNIDSLKPGLTGWAQVNGRDSLSLAEKVALEVEYINKKSVWIDIKILWLTLLKVFIKHDISH
jgi:O-antigen biosynthesis protein WbqP